MSERIDARGDITIAGASGDAVRGGLIALTRWGLPGRRSCPRRAPSRTARGGARRSLRPMAGIGESRTTVVARTGRALPP
jgi:hypothetical protein